MSTATPVTAKPAESAGVRVAAPSAWLVLAAGAVGLVASWELTVEKMRVLADPAYNPSCNLSPFLSCKSVMTSAQASLFGVPNTLAGVVGFTVVTVAGVLAVTKVDLPRWFWLGLTVGGLAAVGFVHWLIFQSLYQIGKLCPYCMVVWAVTIPLLVVLASIGYRSLPAGGGPVIDGLYRWRWSITALWFVTLAVLIFLRFQNYWLTLL